MVLDGVKVVIVGEVTSVRWILDDECGRGSQGLSRDHPDMGGASISAIGQEAMGLRNTKMGQVVSGQAAPDMLPFLEVSSAGPSNIALDSRCVRSVHELLQFCSGFQVDIPRAG